MPKNVTDEFMQAIREMEDHLDGKVVPVRVSHVEVPPVVDVRSIRERTGLSQPQFAARYGFSVATLRDWEQGRRQPDRTARVLLTVIAKNPKAVEEALTAAE